MHILNSISIYDKTAFPLLSRSRFIGMFCIHTYIRYWNLHLGFLIREGCFMDVHRIIGTFYVPVIYE